MNPEIVKGMERLFESAMDLSSAVPYRINTDFKHRFRVWQDQILPERLLSIQQENSVEYTRRMAGLLVSDGARLIDRAMAEDLDDLDTIIEEIFDIVEIQIRKYVAEIRRIRIVE